MRKLTSMFLAAILLLSVSVFCCAEDDAVSANVLDMQVQLGNKVYTIAGKADDLKEQGIRFVKDDLKPGYWQSVDNGRNSFKILLDAADRDNAGTDDTWVCGYRIDNIDCPGAIVAGGFKLGATTGEEVLALYGEPSYTSSNTDGSVFGIYHPYHWYVNAEFTFESDNIDAPLIKVEITTSIPYSFGIEVSEQAGKETENLPDPSTFSFDQFILDGKFYDNSSKTSDLLANGWRYDVKNSNETYDPQGEAWMIFTNGKVFYNGEGMITVYPYNSAKEGTCGIESTDILTIAVEKDDGTSIILADGITIGSTFDDVKATFGTNFTETEQEGYTKYQYTAAHSQFTFNVTDGIVTCISISP